MSLHPDNDSDPPAQSRQSARLFLQSSKLGKPPPSHPQASVFPSLAFGGGGGGSQFGRGDRHFLGISYTVTGMYFVLSRLGFFTLDRLDLGAIFIVLIDPDSHSECGYESRRAKSAKKE